MGQSYTFAGGMALVVSQAAQEFANEVIRNHQRRATVDRPFFSNKRRQHVVTVSVCGSPIPALVERAAFYQRRIGSP